MPEWALLSNHGLTLILLAVKPEATTREIASNLGITERSVQRIISDLHLASYISKDKVGRRNRYEVNIEKALHLPVKQDKCVADLLIGLTK